MIDSRPECSYFVLPREGVPVFMTLRELAVSRARTLTVTAFQARAMAHALMRSR